MKRLAGVLGSFDLGDWVWLVACGTCLLGAVVVIVEAIAFWGIPR